MPKKNCTGEYMQEKQLYKSSINHEAAKSGDLTKKAARLSLVELFANLKAITAASPDADAYLQQLAIRFLWNGFEKNDSVMESNDLGIGGGKWDYPPLLVAPLATPAATCPAVVSHDLLAKSYVAARAKSNESFDRTYAVWLGSGADCFCKFYHDCDNHAVAKNRALAEAPSLDTRALAEFLVIGPWRGDVKVAPQGTLVAAGSIPYLFEVEDPYFLETKV
jgi:hypothetical protein